MTAVIISIGGCGGNEFVKFSMTFPWFGPKFYLLSIDESASAASASISSRLSDFQSAGMKHAGSSKKNYIFGQVDNHTIKGGDNQPRPKVVASLTFLTELQSNLLLRVRICRQRKKVQVS